MTTIAPWPVLVIVAVLGLSVGSFLNVVIYRVPREESVLHPGSHCPRCDTAIKARHNVPVLGWLVLLGKCAACRAPISPRYPLVEAGTAALMVAVTARLGLTPALPAFLFFAAVLVTLVMVYADLRVVPDVIVDPAFVLAGLMLLPAAAAANDWHIVTRSAIAVAVVTVTGLATNRRRPPLINVGEVKFAGFVAVYLGWLSWYALALGALVGVAAVAARSLAVVRSTVILRSPQPRSTAWPS